jgi:hypothetical protein
MPTFVLQLSCEMEGVASIAPLGEEMQYTVDFQQSGGDEVKAGVVVSMDEEVDPGNGSDSCHAILRWGGKTTSSITLMQLPGVTREITADDSGSPVALIAMECRGCEPIAWSVGDGWTVTVAGGQSFEDVDLSEDWSEFDEGTGEPVMVSEISAGVAVAQVEKGGKGGGKKGKKKKR